MSSRAPRQQPARCSAHLVARSPAWVGVRQPVSSRTAVRAAVTASHQLQQTLAHAGPRVPAPAHTIGYHRLGDLQGEGA